MNKQEKKYNDYYRLYNYSKEKDSMSFSNYKYKYVDDTMAGVIFDYYETTFELMKSPFVGKQSFFSRALKFTFVLPLGILGFAAASILLVPPAIASIIGVSFLGEKIISKLNKRKARKMMKRLQKNKNIKLPKYDLRRGSRTNIIEIKKNNSKSKGFNKEDNNSKKTKNATK